MTVRIEHDLLGNREIPVEAYWGIHTLCVVGNFKTSNQEISDVPQFVCSTVIVERAAIQADGELDAVKPEIVAAIEKACDEVLLKGRCLGQFPSDVHQGDVGTSVNTNTNEVIANLALEILGYEEGRYDIINPMDHVNTSQSTNDVYPTGFKLTVYYSAGELLEKLMLLRDVFTAKADELKDVLKMGRTQPQDAVLMTAGQEFQFLQVLLEEEALNLGRTYALLLEVDLGATAIGTGVNAPKGYAALAVKKLSEVNGLDCKLTESLIEATSDCGTYAMAHDALKCTVVKLSKVCNDLCLLSSGPRAGLKEINLLEMQAGSSIMPTKVNPVIPEVINQVCSKVIGNGTAITFAAEARQLQLNMVGPVIAQYMFETIPLLGNVAVNLAEKYVEGITVNREICERYVPNSTGLVAYLNPYIGHGNSNLAGKICAQTGKGVREVVLEHGLLGEAELDRTLSPENLASLHRGT